MSIAQARASRVRPHYILVALLLGVVAAIAFGTLAIRAAEPDSGGDTTVFHDADGDGTFDDGEDSKTILSDDSVDLTVSAFVDDGPSINGGTGSATAVGLLTTSAGALGSADGPTTILVSWTNPAEGDVPVDDDVVDIESEYFPDGFDGAAMIVADNLSVTGGDDVDTIVTSHAAPLDITVAFNSAGDTTDVDLDRIGVSDCDDCNHRSADIIVTVKDAANGDVNGVDVELSLSSITHGRFAGTNPSSVTRATGGDDDDDGVVTFASGTEGIFTAMDTPGTATFTGIVLGASFEAELLVTGAPAELVLSTSRVDRESTDLTSVKDLDAELFSVGLTDSTRVDDDNDDATNDDDTVGTDVFIVYVTVRDADGNDVDAKDDNMPVVTDVTDGVENAILFIGGHAAAVTGFGVADPDADNAGDAVSGDPAVGVANGLGDAKTDDGDADLGSHDLEATWKSATTGSDEMTSNTVSVIVAGEASEGDIETSVETLSPGQVATIDVLFTDADGNIAPDGTPTRIFAAGQTFASTGEHEVSGTTSNGRVSATLLPTGSDAVVTILAQAGEDVDGDGTASATATAQVSQSSGAAAPVASAIVVTADSTELTVGGSTRVSATVTDADDAAVAGALVRFSIDSREKVTDADGSVSAEFMATEAGTFSVTATVVEVRGGLDDTVDTAVSGSVTITVSEPAPEPETVTVNAGFTGWGGSSTTAAQAFAGVDVTIWRWSGTAWELYASALPESLRVNYALEPLDGLFNAGAAVTVEA